MTDMDSGQAYSAVSSMIWRERELLDLLLFKLTEERLILASGQARWLAHANREVETILAELRDVEVLRAVEVDHLAEVLKLGAEPSLTAIIETSAEPWKSLFHDHRESLIALVEEVRGLTSDNQQLLTTGAQAVRETLLALRQEVSTYDSTGTARGAHGTRRSIMVDEQA